MVGATIYAKDVDALTAFYATSFALTAVDGVAGDYAVLEGAGWTLVIVQVPAAIRDSITVDDPPVRRADTPIKLAFEVPSIDALRSRLRVDTSDRAWVSRGFLHCDCVDPEGNVVQLKERCATT